MLAAPLAGVVKADKGQGQGQGREVFGGIVAGAGSRLPTTPMLSPESGTKPIEQLAGGLGRA